MTTSSGFSISKNEVLGFVGFIIWALTALLLVVLLVLGRMVAPCDIPGGTHVGGWYGCNNSSGDTLSFALSMGLAAFALLVLPVSFILGVIGAFKNSASGWAWLAIAPGAVAVLTLGHFPFGLMPLLQG